MEPGFLGTCFFSVHDENPSLRDQGTPGLTGISRSWRVVSSNTTGALLAPLPAVLLFAHPGVFALFNSYGH